jgi:GNAT superfamily N-acetyltransferase
VREDFDEFAAYLDDPSGVWLARDGRTTIGCIVMKPLPQIEGACEVKRMYVREGYRRQGVADRLLDAVHEHARALGFRTVYLDTKDDLLPAHRLYARRGYVPCERYNDNPQATIFMRKSL